MEFRWQRVPFGSLGFDLFTYARRYGKTYTVRLTLHPASMEFTILDLDGDLVLTETMRRYQAPVEDMYLTGLGFEGVWGWEER